MPHALESKVCPFSQSPHHSLNSDNTFFLRRKSKSQQRAISHIFCRNPCIGNCETVTWPLKQALLSAGLTPHPRPHLRAQQTSIFSQHAGCSQTAVQSSISDNTIRINHEACTCVHARVMQPRIKGFLSLSLSLKHIHAHKMLYITIIHRLHDWLPLKNIGRSDRIGRCLEKKNRTSDR